MPVTAFTQALDRWLQTEWDATAVNLRKRFTGGGKQYEIVVTLPDGTRIRIDVKELTGPWD